MNVIMKFGGTSVADAEAMTRVTNIVRAQLEQHPTDRPPVVVVSAMSKVTDRLVETGRLASERQGPAAAQILADLSARHAGVAKSLVHGDALDGLLQQMAREFEELGAAVAARAVDGDVSPRMTDMILSMGSWQAVGLWLQRFRAEASRRPGSMRGRSS